jgi:glycosyltransferase involved in cell wall biosynthesis
MDEFRVLAVIPASGQGQALVFAHRQVAQLKRLGAQVETFSLLSRTNLVSLVGEARRFRQQVKAFNPHVVHAHYGTVTALFCALLALRPLVITFRGTDLNPSSEFSKVRGSLSRWMSHTAAVFAAEIICVSSELRQRLWWRRASVHVIPTGVDVEQFYPMERHAARSRLGWSAADRIVLFNHGSSRAPNKRRDLVDAAMTMVAARIPSARLIVMEGNVAGDEVPLYMNAADVVVMTSDFEGSPNVIKEALACGTPVCSVDVGDTRTMLADVSSCVIVERNPSAIAEGLISLLGVPQRSNGPDFAERYAVQTHLPKVLRVLREARSSRACASDRDVDCGSPRPGCSEDMRSRPRRGARK